MKNEWTPIDGETPIDDLSGLFDKTIRTRAQLHKAEAENILSATVRFLAARPSKRTAPFTYDWMLNVHKAMFGNVWEWAGEPRCEDINIGCEWSLIGQELGLLAMDVDSWLDTWPRIQQAATIHYKAVHIHPFKNGNGRWSRMLANIWLRRHGRPIVKWPEPDLGLPASSVRAEYLAALKACDSHNMDAFFELHERFLESSA